jgi:hypothetical protein
MTWWMRRGIRRLALLLSLTWTGSAGSATPPAVLHSPNDDGTPHPVEFQIGAPGLHELHLYARTGDTQSAPAEDACLDGGGDELCGFQFDFETTGGIRLVSFAPDPAIAADLVWNLVDDSLLRINRLSPAGGGDFGALRLGDLEVENLGPGAVTLRSSSLAVLADLTKAGPTGSPIAVPEPGLGQLMPPALALLALEHRRRRPRAPRQ